MIRIWRYFITHADSPNKRSRPSLNDLPLHEGLALNTQATGRCQEKLATFGRWLIFLSHRTRERERTCRKRWHLWAQVASKSSLKFDGPSRLHWPTGLLWRSGTWVSAKTFFYLTRTHEISNTVKRPKQGCTPSTMEELYECFDQPPYAAHWLARTESYGSFRLANKQLKHTHLLWGSPKWKAPLRISPLAAEYFQADT